MEIDESGWHDLNERLDKLDIPVDEREVLIHHLTDRLVSHFGVDSFECHLGKDDPRRHATREIAAAALAHLVPVLAELPDDAISRVIAADGIGAPVPPPWNDNWRAQQRTASWRS